MLTDTSLYINKLVSIFNENLNPFKMSKKEKNPGITSRNIAEDWKTVDMSKVMAMDLTAAISLLSMIRDTPEVFDGCLRVLESYRKVLIARETEQNELDKMAVEKAIEDSKERLKPVV